MVKPLQQSLDCAVSFEAWSAPYFPLLCLKVLKVSLVQYFSSLSILFTQIETEITDSC